MSRIKGKFVALVECDYDFEKRPGMRSIDEMQKYMRDGILTEAIRKLIDNASEFGKVVKVTQLFGDIYEVEDSDDQ